MTETIFTKYMQHTQTQKVLCSLYQAESQVTKKKKKKLNSFKQNCTMLFHEHKARKKKKRKNITANQNAQKSC